MIKSSLFFYPNARFKSLIKSSLSSIPTLNLINESTTPVFSRSSFGMLACVILAGCPAKDSTPPKDSASVNIFSFSTVFIASFYIHS